jgi:hypothetical protein
MLSEEGFKTMGGAPTAIYSDDEGSLNSKLLENYFKEQNIHKNSYQRACSIRRTWCENIEKYA